MTAIYLIIDNVLFLIYFGLLAFLDTTDIFGSELFGIIYRGLLCSACTIFTNIIMVGWFKMRLIHVIAMLPIVYAMDQIRVSIAMDNKFPTLDYLLYPYFLPQIIFVFLQDIL